MPEISIVVPVYNVEAFLPRCIRSILSQRFSDFELILVDDGSPDRCGFICDEYAKIDSRIRVVHKKNGGVSSARNMGLNYATGNYVTFCDPDDYWKPDWLEWLYTTIYGNDADVANGGFISVDDEGNILRTHAFPSNISQLDNPKKLADYLISDLLSFKYGWAVCTRIFRFSLIKEHNIRFCETCENFAEDLGFVLEFLLYAKIAYTGTYCGYCYYIRPNSMMQSTNNTVKLNAMNEISKHFGLRMESDHLALYRTHFPIMHFLIMYNQYMRLIGKPRYDQLPLELRKIKDQKWFQKQTRRIFSCSKPLKQYFGTNHTQRLLFFSHLCLHKNWKRFSLESAIFYRWIYKGK